MVESLALERLHNDVGGVRSLARLRSELHRAERAGGHGY